MKKLMEQLKSLGIKATYKPAKFADIEDDEVTINKETHIQIGCGYYNLVQELKGGEFLFHEMRSTVEEVIEDVKKYVKL